MLYVERKESSGLSNVLSSSNFFLPNGPRPLSLIENVKDFEIKDDYMFASKEKVSYFIIIIKSPPTMWGRLFVLVLSIIVIVIIIILQQFHDIVYVLCL